MTSGWIVPDPQWHFSKVSSKRNFCFHRKILDWNLSFKHKCLRLVFKYWANHIFRLEVLWNDFQNYNCLSIATSSWRTFSLKNGFFSRSSSVFKRNFSRFLGKILQQSWQKCNLYVQRNNWWTTNFLIKQILRDNYRFSAICFWDLTRSFNRVAKTSQYMPNQNFEENHFFEQKFNYRKFFGMRVKSFGVIFETFSDVFRGSFFQKKINSFQKIKSFPA